MAKTTHIAIISSPGFSHLVPIIEFSNQLVKHHQNFHVTCITPSLGSPPESSKAYLKTLPSFIDFIFLPPINKEQLPQGVYIWEHQVILLVLLTLRLKMRILWNFYQVGVWKGQRRKVWLWLHGHLRFMSLVTIELEGSKAIVVGTRFWRVCKRECL